jgi:hypothetical protein
MDPEVIVNQDIGIIIPHERLKEAYISRIKVFLMKQIIKSDMVKMVRKVLDDVKMSAS